MRVEGLLVDIEHYAELADRVVEQARRRVLQGESLAADEKLYRETFGTAPTLYAADRGFYSAHNIAALADAGVKVESVPQRGGHRTPSRTAHEKKPVFKRAQKFRAGIEGRISVLFRGRGMKRCELHGRQRFEVFVAAAVLANNLLIIASILRHRPSLLRAA